MSDMATTGSCIVCSAETKINTHTGKLFNTCKAHVNACPNFSTCKKFRGSKGPGKYYPMCPKCSFGDKFDIVKTKAGKPKSKSKPSGASSAESDDAKIARLERELKKAKIDKLEADLKKIKTSKSDLPLDDDDEIVSMIHTIHEISSDSSE